LFIILISDTKFLGCLIRSCPLGLAPGEVGGRRRGLMKRRRWRLGIVMMLNYDLALVVFDDYWLFDKISLHSACDRDVPLRIVAKSHAAAIRANPAATWRLYLGHGNDSGPNSPHL